MPVIEPATAEDAARALGEAAAAKQRVLVRGGGTKVSWGRTPAMADVVLSTRGLARLVAHADGDLTATVEAGMPLSALNAELAKRGQWLPVESAFDAATVGGILATNDSGPLSHRFGTPRDLVIGVTLATTNGRIVRAGGKVVKNVAGYDLGKLVAGSFGNLAVIVDATFKLWPRPAASATRRFGFGAIADAAGAVSALQSAPIEPCALEIAHDASSTEVLLRFASSSQTSVDAQAAAAERLVPGARVRHMSGLEEEDVWTRHRLRPWEGEGAVLSLAWLPANTAAVLEAIRELAGADAEFVARAAAGRGLLRTTAPSAGVVSLTTALRKRTDLFHHVTVLRADEATKAAIDVWPDAGSCASLFAAVKRSFDPSNTLNTGRGPL
ncbi:MAG: FAD-binding oxidoreductase [Vicinamibacterales bacterium]